MRPNRQPTPSRNALVAPTRAVVARPPPEDSDYVHDEIRQLGEVAKETFRKLGRPTDEAALLQHLQFAGGPSVESRAMMEKEMLAAETAAATGLYVTYRNEKKGSECLRIGPQHACFCGHSLTQHANGNGTVQKNGHVRGPQCSSCECAGFTYVPNQPEEIGEGWLSRRKNFDIAAWAPKCRCGHGSKAHAVTGGRRCRERGCRCAGFESHFACVVCDSFWEDHETVFETKDMRVRDGRPVDQAFRPLSNVDPQFAQLVFAPKGGAIAEAPGGGTLRLLDGGPEPARAVAPTRELPPWCEQCAAVIRDAKAKFCTQCGARR